MTTKTQDVLQSQIAQLLREHLAAQEKAALVALTRAFEGLAGAGKAVVPRPSGRVRRRDADLADLAERLSEAVKTRPGETMAVIAAQVGETPGALNRPMRHLKQAGRVRSAGERSRTRYFPMLNLESEMSGGSECKQ